MVVKTVICLLSGCSFHCIFAASDISVTMKELNYGVGKWLIDRYNAGELLRDNRLTVP